MPLIISIIFLSLKNRGATSRSYVKLKIRPFRSLFSHQAPGSRAGLAVPFAHGALPAPGTPHEDVVAVVGGAENPVSPVVKPSFSAVVSEKNVSNVTVPVRDENALPNRPLTAFFTPQVRLPAADVFRAF